MTYHEDLYMIYRDRLRALREDSDLSQKTIADYLGIGHPYVKLTTKKFATFFENFRATA